MVTVTKTWAVEATEMTEMTRLWQSPEGAVITFLSR